MGKLNQLKDKAKIPKKLGENQKVVNGEVVEFAHISLQTEQDKLQLELQKIKLENKSL